MSRTLLGVAVVLGVLWLGAGTASAYPQFQLSHDQTCTGCHISPAGGNLLNENGLAVAESASQFGTAPEFMYGKLGGPKWLTLGGDLRGAAGFLAAPTKVLTAFPMQLELYANATFGNFTIHTNFSPRPSQRGNEAATSVWAREHYVMWRQKPDENYGLYARLGRFMPVYGLRFAEHPLYVRRYGNTQLYADTYGAHVAWIQAKYEAHVTGFIKDPLIDPVDHYNGVMAYAEVRPMETLAIGAEGMFKKSIDDIRFGGGVTAKYHIPAAKLLLSAELQYINQVIDKSAFNAAGGAPLQLVGILMGTLTLKDYLFLDVAFEHYDSNLRIKNLDRDSFDANLRYLLTSHIELHLTNRFEMIGFTKGGPSAGFSLLQLHYRL